MSDFLRILFDSDKASSLQNVCEKYRNGDIDSRLFQVPPVQFKLVPGVPFAYWISNEVRQIYKDSPSYECQSFTVKQGPGTSDNFRFVRCNWEIDSDADRWPAFAKGGQYSPFFADIDLVLNWSCDGKEIKAEICQRYPYLNGNWEFVAKNTSYCRRPGLTWSKATTLSISIRFLPKGAFFGDVGPSGFSEEDDFEEIGARIAIMESKAFKYLVDVQLALAAEGRKHYEVGIIQKSPIPRLSNEERLCLANFAKLGWRLKRGISTTAETSLTFLLPSALRKRLNDYDPEAIAAELSRIQTEIDDIAFDLYGFSEAERAAVQTSQSASNNGHLETVADDEADYEDSTTPIDQTAGLLSWAVGVAFGRFDWRLATGERTAPAEPDPFDPLPDKSPGMLPNGVAPFHVHAGILVDDQGHPHDLARLTEEVIACVEAPVPVDVHRWLQRDFFAFHLQRYSKSRRRAPIYWPLSTTSGSYTLWIYYPMLTSQTLYTAINDFIEPKIKQVDDDVTALRSKGSARTREDEKKFETLQTFELELIELRDTLLKLAPGYKPNHDDGVQISAAPLWPMFRHKPWQKVLKDTWAKLEKGDYDWAYLAMNYWPDRVREKCKTDKSIAIAHGLEHLYVELEAQPKKTRGRKKAGGDE